MNYYNPIRRKTGRPPKDITGQRFGKLTALCIIAPGTGDGPLWLLYCDCGNTTTSTKHSLYDRRSCGCARKNRQYYNPLPAPTFNSLRWKRRKLARVWSSMKARCCVPSNTAYDRYGGRGIKVCDEWLARSKPFVEWALQNGFEGGLTIDRIDGDGNYEPSNCRWLDMKEQSRNRHNNVLTPALAEDIKHRLADGQKPLDIARELGFADRPHLVYNIKNNGAWSDKPRNYYRDMNVERPGQWIKR